MNVPRIFSARIGRSMSLFGTALLIGSLVLPTATAAVTPAVVLAPPTLTAAASGPAILGSAVHDTALLSGAAAVVASTSIATAIAGDYPASDPSAAVTADASGATYHTLTPTRLLDTRSGNGLSGVFSSHVARTFQVTTRGGVPANAMAVTGNLTVAQQTAAGYLYIGPLALNNPTSSTLNFPVSDNRANGVTVALSGSGTLSVTYVASTLTPTTQVIFDVTGYFTP